MMKKIKYFIRVTIIVAVVLTWFALVHAENVSTSAPDTLTSKDIIMILFGLLQTVFMGIGIWLISNDKELFTRLGRVESQQAVRDQVCADRSADWGIYRKSDDTNTALKESVDTLRKLLYDLELIKKSATGD